jgi:hypothetical protein
MSETTPVLFFLNGLGAMALSRRREFVGCEISPQLRIQLGIFGTVFFLLGLLFAPEAVWR